MQLQLEFTKLSDLTTLHAVYRLDVMLHGSTNWQLAYVGSDCLRDVLKLHQAKHTPFVAKAFTSAIRFCVTVLSVHPEVDAANAAREALAAQLGAPGNDPVNHMSGHRGGRVAVQRSDGQQYRSITEAARATGCPSQSINHHLAGRYGYANVRGYTFKRLQ